MMFYANACEEGMHGLVFTAPVRLHGTNFAIKFPFHEWLEITEARKHFKFVLKEIYPS
jgi:hypothetical protein